MNRIAARAALLAAVSLLGACAVQPSQPAISQAPIYSPNRGSTQAEYGVVSAIDNVAAHDQVSGTGALMGGVAGAVIGRQFGNSGYGRVAGTVVGTMTGALIGNEIEKQQRGGKGGLRVSVQLDQGGQRSFDLAGTNDLRVGDRVRVDGNQLVRL